MQKIIFCTIFVFLISIFNNCETNTEPISISNEEDTTNTGTWVGRKPNIYIYPEQEINLSVQLNFPNGGEVIKSMPEYGTGWNVNVKPSGLIDDQYEYLFYEADIPNLLQRDFGWKVNGTQLDSFFINNLHSLSFSTKEINDFIEYWIPLFDPSKKYLIYPQFNEELSDIIQLDISIKPDNLIRVWYVIKEFENNVQIEDLVIPLFERNGYVILEWGVVLE